MGVRNPRTLAVDQLEDAIRELRELKVYFERRSGLRTFDPPTSPADNVQWRDRHRDEYPENQSVTWEYQARVTVSVTRAMQALNVQAREEWRRLNPTLAPQEPAPSPEEIHLATFGGPCIYAPGECLCATGGQ